MARIIKRASEKRGLPPGSIIHIGEKKIENTRIRVIDYDSNRLEEKELASIEQCFPYKDKSNVSWVNIDGLHEVDLIEKVGKHFNLHPLLLEDVVNTQQRPKLEDYGSYLFLVVKMLYCNNEKDIIEAEQMSFVLGSNNMVISFQERVGDVFEPVRERIRNKRGRIRDVGADYLLYALIDAIVDNYFVVLERVGENIEELEEELVANPSEKTLQKINRLKREMTYLRKSVWPIREVIGGLDRGDSPLIDKSTETYLRDLYDHTIQVIDTIETFRDLLSGMLDVYLSTVGNRMNEVMKVLTMIATVFIPLTFIAGIYGMNFEYMPELTRRWAYFAVLGVMVIVGCFMLTYFRRKKWL